jgi:ubiquinone/menaquinone biosynthesis C-methylase UbiE
MKFVNPQQIVNELGLKSGYKVTDLGCGSGFYVVAVARAVGNTGRVAAVDVQDAKLVATKSITLQNGFHNVEVFKADLEKSFDAVPLGQEDVVIVASVLHEVSDREAVLKNAYALLKSGGKLLAVDWKKEHSPFGPAMDKRIGQQELLQLLQKMGFLHIQDINADMYHYAMIFEKQ